MNNIELRGETDKTLVLDAVNRTLHGSVLRYGYYINGYLLVGTNSYRDYYLDFSNSVKKDANINRLIPFCDRMIISPVDPLFKYPPRCVVENRVGRAEETHTLGVEYPPR